jgi:hypothetical protein
MGTARPVLVRAHVVSVDRLAFRTSVKFAVDDVLVGPQVGENPVSFSGYSLKVDIRGDAILPAPAVGERGIWVIQKVGSDWIIQTNNHELVDFPARQGITPHYERLEKLTQTISSVYKLPAESQVQRLKETAIGPDAYEGAWAIRRLEALDVNVAIDLCRHEETVKRMTFRAALVADLVLARNQIDDAHVLKRVLEGCRQALPEDDQLSLGTMLGMRCQIGKTRQAAFEELMVAYILNNKHVRNSRHAALFSCQFLARRGAEDAAFRILRQVKSQSNELWLKEEAVNFEKRIGGGA